MGTINISDPAVRGLSSDIRLLLQEASNMLPNISMLIAMGKAEEAGAMINMLLEKIGNIEALIEELDKKMKGKGILKEA